MSTTTFPVFVPPSGGALPTNLRLGGSIQNVRSSLQVALTYSLPEGSVIASSNVVIDKWLKTSSSTSSLTPVGWFFNSGSAKFIIGSTESADVVYNFVTGTSYKITFQVSVQNTSNNSVVMYQSVYKYNYLNPAPTFLESGFTFDPNVASGDDILISDLNLPSAPFPPVSVTFQFNQLELAHGDINNEIDEEYSQTLPYDPSGNYTLTNNTLQNGNAYLITATANWSEGYQTSINCAQDLFILERPSISSVVPYDAHNDGGNDGVNIGEVDADANDQVIATITLTPAGYNNYIPSTVKFIFYDMANNEIGSSDQTYATNGQSVYDIRLNSVILVSSPVPIPLLNGMPGYTVKALVILPVIINNIDYTQIRSSDKVPVVFRQGIAPILPLIIGNTWDLVSNGNPSSAAALYNSSPDLGISGHFLKNGQFMSGYARNLDTTATKFLLQYTLNGGQPNNVVRAALVQPVSPESKEQAMIRAMGSAVNSANGQYTNVVGPSGTSGPSQNPLVFYIPNGQGSVTFNETDVVNVSVTVIDTSNQWLDPSNNVTNTSSSVSAANDLTLVNQIPTYSYDPATMKGTSVEPYINNVDVSNNVVSVLTDNVLSTVAKTSIIADSNTGMITQSFKGWTVVTPDAVMGGNPPILSHPEVNLHYFNKNMRSNSIRVNEVDGLGMWYVINQNAGAKLYPFLIVYTDPTQAPANNNRFPGFYKSKLLYGPDPNSNATLSGFTLLYTGNDDGTLYSEIPANRRVKLLLSDSLSDKNPDYSNEYIGAASIHTSSDANTVDTGDFNFTLLYAGVIINGSYTTTLFTDPLLNVNIPVNNTFSSFFNSSFVKNVNTPSSGFVIENDDDTSVSSFVLPTLTQSKYNVQYSIVDPNHNNAVVRGLVSATTTISTLNTPQTGDFTVSNFVSNTANNNDDGEVNILFDLTISPYALDRIDGVHVYFTSDSNSNIPLTKIGTFKTNQVTRKIVLVTNNSNILNPAFGSNLIWNHYTNATITFVAFRDNRVDSAVDETDNPFTTWTAPTITNIPGIAKPSVSGTITLTGGVTNSSNDTVLNWVNDTSAAYSYTLTMAKGNATPVSVQYTTNANTVSAILAIDTESNSAYTLSLKKVFQEESSPADTITFNTVKVDTSAMDISVLNPSSQNSITVSWKAPTITGTGSSFENNVDSLWLSNNGIRIDTSNSAPNIEVQDPSGNNYTINGVIGSSYQLRMNVYANVMYSVNGGALTKSSPVAVPLGRATNYTVSTIPNVSLSSANSTVLMQGTTTPTLLLNLNANGVEDEGFISLVVVLTQDGTPNKPEGCEVLLQFPNPLNSTYLNDPSYNNLNHFLFSNVVGAAGSGSGNANLVGGESSSVAPLNLLHTGLSNNVGNYTLTIGSVNTSGRYGLSSLTFPAGSGFVNSQDSNIMAILTTRCGTDIMVGSFNFVTPPVASNVSITTTNGQYYVNFNLN